MEGRFWLTEGTLEAAEAPAGVAEPLGSRRLPSSGGTCAVSAQGGQSGTSNGTNGVVSIESYSGGLPGCLFGGSVAYADPISTFLPPSMAQPTLQVVSVNGVAVPQPPTASFTPTDVSINVNSTTPVTIVLQASQIPVGKVINLELISDNGGPDVIVNSTPLAGTLASSTATATFAFPSGYSWVFVTTSF